MRDDPADMRTTLDIDDDLLQAAKEMAESRNTTAGRIVSDLLRKALQRPDSPVRVRNGVPLLSRAGGAPVLTMKRVNELRDDG
jgi:hypothetical protein